MVEMQTGENVRASSKRLDMPQECRKLEHDKSRRHHDTAQSVGREEYIQSNVKLTSIRSFLQ